MEIILTIVGLILTVLLALIPFFRNKYANRPRLEMQLLKKGGSSHQLGISQKNDFSKGELDAITVIRVFELKYRFELKIVNNSDYVAYYPRLIADVNRNNFTNIDPLPKHPITNSSEILLKAEFVTMEECSGFQRSDTSKFPKELEGVKILLEYQNTHKTKFYTLFTIYENGNENTLLRKLP
jgi:hypothetical protein